MDQSLERLLTRQTSSRGVETTGPGVFSIYHSQIRRCSSKYPSQSTSPYLFFPPDKPGISQRRTSSSPTGLQRSCPVPHPSRVHGRRLVPSLDSTPSGNISTSPHDCLVRLPPPQLYHGPIDHPSWLLAIFGPSPQCVSCVTLFLSLGSPHRTGLPPPLATLDSLPEVVEVLRVASFLTRAT